MAVNIGRNDPCTCGSGKKYKKCCMLKEYNPAKDIREELQGKLQNQEINFLDDAIFTRPETENTI